MARPTTDPGGPSATVDAAEPPSVLVARLKNLWDRSRRFGHVFRGSRLGMVGLIILLVFIFMALSAPLLTSTGVLRDPDVRLCGEDLHYCTPTDPDPANLLPPSGQALLGTDHIGRDNFSRLWWGTQVTVLIGVLASIMSMGLGTLVGMVSGYYGGWVDEALMRITDFFLVLPTLVLALILTGYFAQSGGGSLETIVARLVRAQVLSLKQRQFVERARAVGAGNMRIVWVHIFPNAFSLVFAEAVLTIAVAILTETFLSYLGLGPANVNTWGKMIEDALNHSAIELNLTWWVIAPGLAIVGVVMGFTLLGYALDEIFNPRLRRR